MTGSAKDIFTIILAYTSIFALTIFFFSTIAVYYWTEVTIAIPIIGIFLSLSVTYFMLRSTFSDPGVISRGDLEMPEEEDK